MNKYLIATDLDGTLLNSKKKISEEDVCAINKALDQGNVIVFNSGRPTCGIKKLVSPYDLLKENTYIISYQGGVCFDPAKDENIYYSYMDPEDVYKIMTMIDSEGVLAIALDDKATYTIRQCETLDRYNSVTWEDIIEIEDFTKLRDVKVNKILAIEYEDLNKLEIIRKKFEANPLPDVDSLYSTVNFYEFIKAGTSKGIGIRRLAEHLNIPIENTIAVGDERNDISMLQAAGIGVAVKNAHIDTQKAADYVTMTTNDESAFAEVLEKFVLKKD